MSGCKFTKAWVGECGEPTEQGSEFCAHHRGMKCSNPGCENQAIAECSAAVSLVCGAPYCEECGSHFHCYPKKQTKRLPTFCKKGMGPVEQECKDFEEETE